MSSVGKTLYKKRDELETKRFLLYIYFVDINY